MDLLSELSRATTAYHDAPADLVEYARQEYMVALHNFNEAQGRSSEGDGVRSFSQELERANDGDGADCARLRRRLRLIRSRVANLVFCLSTPVNKVSVS